MDVDGSAVNDESNRQNVFITVTDSRPKSTTPNTKGAASSPSACKILYGVQECPPWSICAFLALQVGYLTNATNSEIPHLYFSPGHLLR